MASHMFSLYATDSEQEAEPKCGDSEQEAEPKSGGSIDEVKGCAGAQVYNNHGRAALPQPPL
jgi:hypothetical protein